MTSKAATVQEYLEQLPESRRVMIETVRDLVNQAKPSDVEEGMNYGMIGWYVPHSVFPAGYHCDPKQPLPYANLASQKAYVSLYLFCVYSSGEDRAWLEATAAERGYKLDMGKSCIRFKKLEDVPWDLVAEVIGRMSTERFIDIYQNGIGKLKGKKKG